VDAARFDADRVAEDLAIGHQLALQLAGDLIALGHDVVGGNALFAGQAESGFELGEVGGGDDPGLVGKDVEAGAQGGEDAVDLGAILAVKTTMLPRCSPSMADMGSLLVWMSSSQAVGLSRRV